MTPRERTMELFKAILAAIGVVLAVAYLHGCQPKPVIVYTANNSLPVCGEKDPAPVPGSCGPRYAQGFSCVVCAHSKGCVDENTHMYCVATSCDDPACTKR